MTFPTLKSNLGFWFLSAIFIFVGASSATARADETPPAATADNPFIELYKLRVAQAELNAERRAALDDLASRKLERGRRLIAQQAIAREDFEVLTSEASVARSDRTLAAKKIDEAKTYLRIIEALVKKGIAIPLCTYEME